MNKIIPILSGILFSVFCSAQNTSLHFIFPQSGTPSTRLISYNLKELYSQKNTEWPRHVNISASNGKAACQLTLPEPLLMKLEYKNKTSSYLLISPGDELTIDLSALNGPGDQLKITGKGSNNNQEIRFDTRNFDDLPYTTDSLPDKLLGDLKKKKTKDSLALQAYIVKYKPSATYINIRNIELKYDVLQRFYEFKGNHKFKLRQKSNFESLYALWREAEMDLRKVIPLSNEEALISPEYVFFIRNFLLREKEALWEMAQKEPAKFFKEWYATENTAEGAALMQEDPENLLTEKIINKYFSGGVAEFAYAHLIGSRMGDKEDNLLAIYNRFRQSYPNSLYLARLEPAVQVLKEKDSRVLNDKMIFVKDMDSLTSFEEIKALVKGETVLLDMWGTWCGPCRKEIDENSEALKEHFKEKKVRFLYISNFDTGKEALWKKLIAYYRLEGTHILANARLTKSIMSTVKGTGYPTYVIIKKDGSFELSKGGYPMDRKKLIKQIEDAL